MSQANARLDRVVHVRLTRSEHEQIRELCRELKTSTSEYLRSLARIPKRMANPGECGLVVYNSELYLEFVRLIRIWGYHYNNCLHALNIIASKKFMFPEDAAELFGKAISELDSLEQARVRIEDEVARMAEADRIIIKPKKRGDAVKAVRRPIAEDEMNSQAGAL